MPLTREFMKNGDSPESAFGGTQFNTTRWSVVLLAGESRSEQSREALETLCRTYWTPLYAFIRRQGHTEEDARDLTQKFFALLLERKDLNAMDPLKGKFRTFLLTALSHFLSNERDHARAAKRGGGKELIPLNELETERGFEAAPTPELSPDRVFDQRWAMMILQRALENLRTEQIQAGRVEHFEELRNYLTDDPEEGEYATIASRIGITTQALAVRVHRLRQRFRELVRAQVAQTVVSPLDLEQEMRHLFEALSDSL
jgi:RNA polymerase sigma-70 factor (ECF subfamily)